MLLYYSEPGVFAVNLRTNTELVDCMIDRTHIATDVAIVCSLYPDINYTELMSCLVGYLFIDTSDYSVTSIQSSTMQMYCCVGVYKQVYTTIWGSISIDQ